MEFLTLNGTSSEGTRAIRFKIDVQLWEMDMHLVMIKN